jgi:hypothetical protein
MKGGNDEGKKVANEKGGELPPLASAAALPSVFPGYLR